MSGDIDQHGAVRFLVPDNPAAPRTLRGRLEKLRAEQGEQLIKGYAQDWGDYCKRQGEIKGLDVAIRECEAVESEQRE